MSSLNISPDFIRQDLKVNPITEEELDQLKSLSGSYESLFNKRSRLYKERNLKEQKLSESDFKALILEHYTFLKRPVFLIGENAYIGNSKSTVEALRIAFDEQ